MPDDVSSIDPVPAADAPFTAEEIAGWRAESAELVGVKAELAAAKEDLAKAKKKAADADRLYRKALDEVRGLKAELQTAEATGGPSAPRDVEEATRTLAAELTKAGIAVNDRDSRMKLRRVALALLS